MYVGGWVVCSKRHHRLHPAAVARPGIQSRVGWSGGWVGGWCAARGSRWQGGEREGAPALPDCSWHSAWPGPQAFLASLLPCVRIALPCLSRAGWDYSARWFADSRNLTTIRTTRIIPAGGWGVRAAPHNATLCAALRRFCLCAAACLPAHLPLQVVVLPCTCLLPLPDLNAFQPKAALLTTHQTPLRLFSPDLNAFLYQMEENIADIAAELGCPSSVEQQFRQLAADRRSLHVQELGVGLDGRLVTERRMGNSIRLGSCTAPALPSHTTSR